MEFFLTQNFTGTGNIALECKKRPAPSEQNTPLPSATPQALVLNMLFCEKHTPESHAPLAPGGWWGETLFDPPRPLGSVLWQTHAQSAGEAALFAKNAIANALAPLQQEGVVQSAQIDIDVTENALHIGLSLSASESQFLQFSL